MTPKQKRLEKPRAPEDDEAFPPTLDPEFDQLSDADSEFARWRWPERTE